MNRLIFLVIFLAVGTSVTYYITQTRKEKLLPVINPVDIEAEMVDPDVLMKRKGYGHTIGDFSFLNQNGEVITQKEVENKVFVAEYFFTHPAPHLQSLCAAYAPGVFASGLLRTPCRE